MAPELPYPTLGDSTDAVGASPRAFVEQAPIETYVKSLSHGLEAMYVSPQIETMLGWASEDFCRPGLVLEVIHPHDRERVIAASQRVREPGERFSGLPAVFTADAANVDGHARDGALVVGKPFTPQSLLHTVQVVITADRGVAP